jgi:predicted SprT family Zn-dependent metalloprotease
MARDNPVLSALAVFAVLGFVGLVLIVSSRGKSGGQDAVPASGAARGPGAGPSVRTPTSASRLNSGLAAEPSLANEFDDLNRFFDHRVPQTPIRWEERLDEMGEAIAPGFRVEGLTNGKMILLNPSLRRDDAQRRRTIAHEMVHVVLWNQHDEHGPAFQELLRDVGSRGAFTGIVATDEEKEALRRKLREQSAALESEERALVALRKELEAADQGDPGMDSRVQVFNGRVASHKAAVTAYNEGVAQYNLMISYPDGLDRERLARRTPESGRQ